MARLRPPPELAAEWMGSRRFHYSSWCYRMLREHAFDSGSLFSLNLENDQQELEQEVVRDYWRTFYYPLDAEALGSITGYWKSPDQLHGQVRKLLAESEALGSPRPAPEQTLSAAQAERSARLTELKAPWPAWLMTWCPRWKTPPNAKPSKAKASTPKAAPTGWAHCGSGATATPPTHSPMPPGDASPRWHGRNMEKGRAPLPRRRKRWPSCPPR